MTVGEIFGPFSKFYRAGVWGYSALYICKACKGSEAVYWYCVTLVSGFRCL